MNADVPTPAQRLLELLPVHVRARDEQTGGLLHAVVEAVAEELAVLEGDIDELFASWFIETCPEWVVPYIADIVGVTDLPPDLAARGTGLSRRAFVANTVAYRRRKGTVAVIEQVARDVTGWPARAVEYYRLLAASTHLNHVRRDRPATATLRMPAAAAGPLELVPIRVAQGALDPVAHTVDVRRIVGGRGRYGIGNVGVFLFPDQVNEAGWAPARPPRSTETGWWVHPLRLGTPLFAKPAPEEAIERLATEADLPVPLRPRRLLALLRAAREAGAGAGAAALPVGVRVNGSALDATRLRVYGLEDVAVDPESTTTPPGPLPGWQVMIDAITGRLYPYHKGVAATPKSLEVRHFYGGTAEVGAGGYDRSFVHADVLADDPYVGDPARGGPGVNEQVAIVAGQAAAGDGGRLLADAMNKAQDAWTGPESPAGGTYVISVGDNSRYESNLTVHVPTATRLVLVAASWLARRLASGEVLDPADGVYGTQDLRPHVVGTLTITGDGGSSVVIDGLVIEGDVVVGEGSLGSLALSQCTVAGAVRVGVGSAATNRGVAVRVVRSVCGSVVFGRAAGDLEVSDSIVDAAFPPSAGGAELVVGTELAVAGEGLALHVRESTVLGAVAVRTLEASSAILDGRVAVEQRQVGCVRYSFVEPGSRVPRRYRSAPAPGADQHLRPAYASVDAGSPRHLALAPGCSPAIAQGGEGESEMGVHHHLQRPARVRAAARLLAPYVPVALEIGVAAPVATGRSVRDAR